MLRSTPPFRSSRPRAAALLAALALTASLAADAPAFDVQRHGAMTGEVLASLGSPVVVTLPVVLGAIDPDMSGWAFGYCAPAFFPPCPPGVQPSPAEINARYAMQHFDSNHIWPGNGGIDWVNFLINDARGRIAGYNGSASSNVAAYYGLIEAGMAMHAVQDFYAHSNYLEFQDRLFTRVDQIPIWDGVDLGGATRIPPRTGSLMLTGIQTGYYLLPTAPGGTTHDVLCKDNPGTPEGAAIWQNLIFQNRATYYQVASGQTAISQAYTAGGGVAPRHTERVWQSLMTGIAVFNDWPLDGKANPGPLSTLDIEPQIAAMAADTNFAALGREAGRLQGQFDGANVASFPSEAFDSTKVPLRFSVPAHDAWIEWGGTANPGGAWSYGWTDAPGAAFHLDDVYAVSPGKLATWSSAAGGGSRVAASPVDSVSHEGGTRIAGGTLSLIPGAGGKRAVVRWTAPGTASYDMTARFTGQSGFGGTPLTTSDVQVWVNGAIQFADTLNAPGHGGAAAWKSVRTLAAGSTVDFVVGEGAGGATNDATGLHVFIVPSSTVSAAPAAVAPGVELAPLAPNPSRGELRVRFTLPSAAYANVAVYDLAGREVATLADGSFEAGTHTLQWNGRLDRGHAAPAGVYYVRLSSGAARRDERFVLVR